MKIKVLLLTLLLNLFIAVTAGEFRGAWIHSPVGIPKWGWDATVKALAENGYNALFPNLAWAACAEYPSAVLTPHPSLTGKDGAVRDSLQECLEACRKYGLELHVWIVACNMGHRTPSAVKKQFRDGGRTQWEADGTRGDYLAPHLPENVKLLKDAVAEILKKYPVDGIHLDYIRYPGGKYDFSDSARDAFLKWSELKEVKWPEDCNYNGKHREKFLEWRRENITNLVREVRKTMKEIRPDCALSTAVYGYWPGARMTIGQDAALWAREGLVDFLCPMNYSGDAWEAGKWLRDQLRTVDGAVPIYSGLGNYKCQSPEDLMTQISDTRRFGADGFITFQHNELFATKWLPELRKTVTADIPVRPFPHQQARLAAKWAPAPAQWLGLRYWRFGDTLQCVVQWPKGSRKVKVWLRRDGQRITAATEAAEVAGKQELKYQTKLGGFYRWEAEWMDADGKCWSWQSSPRFVHYWP